VEVRPHRQGMPNRIIREGWVDSEKIDLLKADEECFFLRLCLKADDYGRFSANPKLLRSALYPLKDDARDADISRKLAAAEQAGLIRCYEVDNKRYLQITEFRQQIRSASKFPEPMSSKCTADAKQPIANDHLGVSVFGVGGECVFGGGARAIPTILKELGLLYHRKPSGKASHYEESTAFELSRRPEIANEIQEVIAYRSGLPPDERKFFPQSLSSLLGKWQEVLDRIKSNGHRAAKSIIDKDAEAMKRTVARLAKE